MREQLLRGLQLLELKKKEKRLIIIVLICGVIIGMGVFLFDNLSEVRSLQRGDYGQGEEEVILAVTLDGEAEIKDYELTIEVEERQYTSDEILTIFQLEQEVLDEMILGENESFDRVNQPLNLIEKSENYPIDITWKWSPYSVLDSEGNLVEEEIPEEGVLVEIIGTLSYGEYEVQYIRNAMIYQSEKTNVELWLQKIEEAIQEKDTESVYEKVFLLPEEVDGVNIKWSYGIEYRGVIILLLTCIGVLLWLYKKIEKKKEMEKVRTMELIVDYPEIVNRIVLLVGAGMTVRGAWSKMIGQYDKTQLRYVHKEMIITEREMKNGISEPEAYEHFGIRCNVSCYRKLGNILSQNVRKGSKGLLMILEVEACEARELRKSRARLLGETAATKLLMPMFLMLAIVLIVIVIPAFLTVQV